MLKNSIQPIDRKLSGAPTPSKSELVSNDSERVLRIPQSSKIGPSTSNAV